MLLSVDIKEKSIGPSHLLEGFGFVVDKNEKIGLVGRNGVGKTTLFRILSGNDKDYTGEIRKKKGVKIAATHQEFPDSGDLSCIDYIKNNLPQYLELKNIIYSYPDTMGSNTEKISDYTDALEQFSSLGYHNIENEILSKLNDFQIDEETANLHFSKLSGGQKRFTDLVRVELSHADIALIDEPTNHMDFVAKESFIKWFNQVNQAVIVITHDRDVLANVARIVEIKDKKALSFKGNYESYLEQNGITTVSRISDYEVTQKELKKLKKQIQEAKTKKLAAPPDTAKKFRIMEDRLQREYDKLNELIKKPSFWVDKETISEMPDKVVEKYDKYKARNIRIHNSKQDKQHGQLIAVKNLSLGYLHPLFSDRNFVLRAGEKLEIYGRNGAGKTTLIKAILEKQGYLEQTVKTFEGEIVVSSKVKVGYYEQEVEKYLGLTLAEAITEAYKEKDIPINDQKLRQVLSDYLFNPQVDGKIKIQNLSGGQKARLQIIKMLCNNPNLLILDEPTNHLDLPSIEELEKTLASYEGAVIFVSHDSYFKKNFEAEVMRLK